jgi:sterol desaturase/sphingolipid hydroxylase (fatty acid hydroxylase superfamily)
MELSRLPQLLLYQALLPMLGYLVIGTPFMLLERRFPAEPIAYRRRLLADLGGCAFVFISGLAVSFVVYDGVIFPTHLRWRFDFTEELPAWVAVPLALIATDFTLYWVHRALHSRWLWRLHRWHHSPADIYWLSGIRASFPQNVLYVLVPVAWAIALHVPDKLFGHGGLAAALVNDFMHTNLRLEVPWLERFVVTPRVHRVHHRKTATEGLNFGAFLSVWDHLFGTWKSPAAVDPSGEYGISDKVHPVRLVIGL